MNRKGLSPRGRGKQLNWICQAYYKGSIPAWAGETLSSPSPKPSIKVYPRVGGGNSSERACRIGSHGLSPRGRGKPSRRCQKRAISGSIPAWAGETVRTTLTASGATVYPRVGGGNAHNICKDANRGGLSPRGRGKPIGLFAITEACRSIPAWAGETAGSLAISAAARVYPRVGGGNSSGFLLAR